MLSEQLQEALESRAVIEQAKGILIAERGCDPDEAFDVLRTRSQRENRKLRDVAGGIVLDAMGQAAASG
jgi:AmiR/NasT family two-component response regulator